jgi:hypothetical protein
MHRLLIACVAGAALMTILPDRANAMTVAPGAPLALNHSKSLIDQVAYGCQPVWRCGPWGCGWRRACFWRPGPYAYYRPYGFYRPYAFARPWGYRPWGYGYRRYW